MDRRSNTCRPANVFLRWAPHSLSIECITILIRDTLYPVIECLLCTLSLLLMDVRYVSIPIHRELPYHDDARTSVVYFLHFRTVEEQISLANTGYERLEVKPGKYRNSGHYKMRTEMSPGGAALCHAATDKRLVQSGR